MVASKAESKVVKMAAWMAAVKVYLMAEMKGYSMAEMMVQMMV